MFAGVRPAPTAMGTATHFDGVDALKILLGSFFGLALHLPSLSSPAEMAFDLFIDSQSSPPILDSLPPNAPHQTGDAEEQQRDPR